MTTHRFFIPPENFMDGQVSFPAGMQPQLSRVLRLKPGDVVEVLDGDGNAAQVKLEQDPVGSWFGQILSMQELDTETRVRLTLLFGLSRREKVEWILQKGTEVGVAAFQPFISRRSLVRQTDDAEKHHDRWEAILREAAEQCGRGRIPELMPPLVFPDAVDAAVKEHELVIAAWEEEAAQGIKVVLENQKPASIGLFCGPEGGFDVEEIDLMQSAGVKIFSLGNRILRMETAAIVAPALVLYELGELNPSE